MSEPVGLGLRFGFRRRCSWCGVTLRGWQLNLCHTCGWHVRSDVFGRRDSGPPVPAGSRWDARPDGWTPRSEGQGS